MSTSYALDNRPIDALACSKRSLALSAPTDVDALIRLSERYDALSCYDEDAANVHRKIIQVSESQAPLRDLGKSYLWLAVYEVGKFDREGYR